MLVPNHYFHRIAAMSMVFFGFYIFMKGVNTNEYRVLDDGSLIDSLDTNLVCFKQARTILTFKAGFDVYRSISYGLSSLCLFADLVLHSGYLSLPALVFSAGEIVNDFSDFCLAVVLIFIYIGGYPAAAYGVTYLMVLMVEITIWLGTCKFHEHCRVAIHESNLLRKKQYETKQLKKAS